MHLLEKRRPISEVPIWQKILAFAPSASKHQTPDENAATISVGQRQRAQLERVLWATAIGNSPHRAVTVLADEETSVMRHRHPDGARPNRGVVDDEAGHEVLIFAGRYPVLQARADHLVAGPFSPGSKSHAGPRTH